MNLTERYEKALTFAARTHGDHCRKGTAIPYLSHLLHASAIVMENGGDEDECIAALLHDVIEDRPEVHGGEEATMREIESRWGKRVLKIVREVTNTDELPKPKWADTSLSGKRVSLADRLANLRSILMELRTAGPVLWEKFSHGRDETLRKYRGNIDQLRKSDPGPLVEEMHFVLLEIERLSR